MIRGYGIVLRQLTKMMTCSHMNGQRKTGMNNDIREIKNKTFTLGYGIIMENMKIVLSDNQILLIDQIYDTPCSPCS